MDRINGVLDMAALADCDLVIEAVFEDMGLKGDLHQSQQDLQRRRDFGGQYISFEY